MADANSIRPSFSQEVDRLYDVGALIAAVIKTVDPDSQEGNDLYRVLTMAKSMIVDAAINLDYAWTLEVGDHA